MSAVLKQCVKYAVVYQRNSVAGLDKDELCGAVSTCHKVTVLVDDGDVAQAVPAAINLTGSAGTTTYCVLIYGDEPCHAVRHR